MAAKAKIKLKGGMELLIFDKSFKLSHSGHTIFLGRDIETKNLEVGFFNYLRDAFNAAYNQGREDMRNEINKKYKEFIDSMEY